MIGSLAPGLCLPGSTGATAVASQTSIRTALIKIKPASRDGTLFLAALISRSPPRPEFSANSLHCFGGRCLHRLETFDRGTRVEQQPFPAELNVEAGAPYHLQCGGIEGR